MVSRMSALQRADRTTIIEAYVRQPIELFGHRRHGRHHPPEGVCRDAEARRHVDALDARELPELRTLAAHDGDLGLVDLAEAQHVVAHLTALPLRPPPESSSLPVDLWTLRSSTCGEHCQHIGGPCGKPPLWGTLVMAEGEHDPSDPSPFVTSLLDTSSPRSRDSVLRVRPPRCDNVVRNSLQGFCRRGRTTALESASDAARS